MGQKGREATVDVLPLDRARTLAFAADLRSDLVLLEADEALVSEILHSGQGHMGSAFESGCERQH